MSKAFGTRWTGWLVGAVMLLVLAAACGETVVKEVPVERIVTKEVPVEKIVIATPVPAGAKQWAISALEANPKYGGMFRKGQHGPPSHFDWYASGTIANMGIQAPMYDGLVRRDPRYVSMPIIPDLAHRWEISSDAKTYTFFLREGVRFHDGSDLTAEDVEATFERIIFPPEGIVSLRKPLFSAVEKITVVDDHTIKFVLGGNRSPAFMMASFAVGHNQVSKKESFEANDSNLRKVDNHPGTGPFKYVSRDTEKWVLEANPNYWNENTPYVDGITGIWFRAWTPELAAALLGGKIDYAMWLDTVTWEKVGKTAGMTALEHSKGGVTGIGFNLEHPPLDDVRVRQAINLALDKPALIEASKNLRKLTPGSWYIPGTEFAPSASALAAQPGRRSPTAEDLALARQLLTDAGFPDGAGFPELNFVARETPDRRIIASAVQAMLQTNLGITAKIKIAQASAIAEDAEGGNFDIITGGHGGTLQDPSDYLFPAFGQCNGGLCDQNTSRYRNAEFDKLAAQFIPEVDPVKRAEIAAQIGAILDRDLPLIPIGHQTATWGFYDYVKGLPPGDFAAGYDVFKFDNVWLDR